MKKRLLVSVVTIALFVLTAAFATAAQAFPTRTTACTGCHSGPAVPVTATLVSTVGTTATYNVSAPSADSIAVFDGSTKIFTFTATSGQFSVTTGKTYTIFAVAGPSTSDGVSYITVTPATPAPADTTAPVTTSNAVATYVSSATIRLSATDAGSGVAATYYKLDGGAQVAGTTITVSTAGSHTIEFWSVDVAGNAEAHKTASFTITTPAPAPVTDTYTVRLHVGGSATRGRTAVLTGTTGTRFTAVVGRGGTAVFHSVPAGTYRLSVVYSTSERYVRTVVVRAPRGDDDSREMRHLQYLSR